MQLPPVLVFGISFVIGLAGILFLFFPQWIKRLEALLNAPWGDREVGAVRFGTHGEQAVERMMNREVGSQQIIWDGWLQRHPKPVGLALCLLAVLLAWQV